MIKRAQEASPTTTLTCFTHLTLPSSFPLNLLSSAFLPFTFPHSHLSQFHPFLAFCAKQTVMVVICLVLQKKYHHFSYFTFPHLPQFPYLPIFHLFLTYSPFVTYLTNLWPHASLVLIKRVLEKLHCLSHSFPIPYIPLFPIPSFITYFYPFPAFHTYILDILRVWAL